LHPATETNNEQQATDNEPMNKYYLNKRAQANGQHEVHKEGCLFFPNPEHALYLGVYTSCHEAVAEAKRKFNELSNGCYTCARECNEG